MTRYPYYLPESELTPWQRSVVGVVVERAWEAAARTIYDRLPIAPEDIVDHREFARSLAVLAIEAPAGVVEMLRGGGLGPLNGSIALWRSQVIGEMIQDNLARSIEASVASNYLPAQHYLVGAIRLRAREAGHEAMIAGAFTALATQVRETEGLWTTARPDLSINPAATAPAASDIAEGVQAPATHYHPYLLSSIVDQMIDAGASDTLLALAIRTVALHARWPSWRALAREIAQSMAILAPRATAVIEQEKEISTGAKSYLEFGVTGREMPDLPPSPSKEDAAF